LQYLALIFYVTDVRLPCLLLIKAFNAFIYSNLVLGLSVLDKNEFWLK